MAEQQSLVAGGGAEHRLSGATVLYASLTGVAIGGPLFGMIGLIFAVTAALLLVASPLLFLSSPVLVPAALVVAAAMAGFGAAGAMGLAGTAVLCKYVWQPVRVWTPAAVGRAVEMVQECGRRAKEPATDVGGHVRQKVETLESRIDGP